MSSDNIIDAHERFSKANPGDDVRREPSPEEVEKANRRTRTRWHTADRVREDLKNIARISDADRPTLARNLGRLVEKQFPDQTHAKIRELFDAAFKSSHESAESALKKRKRYLRLTGEPLPESIRPGEYNAGGQAFVNLADAFANMSPRGSTSLEDERRRTILNLIDGTSFDDRDSGSMRRSADGRNEFTTRMGELLERVERAVNLDAYFDTTGNVPLNGSYDSNDPLRWKNLRIDPPHFDVGFGPQAEDGEEWEAIHFLAPFVALGRLMVARRVADYIPLRLARAEIERVFEERDPRTWLEAERVLNEAVLRAVDAQHGERYRRMFEELDERAGSFSDELGELWGQIAVDATPGHEPLVWDTYPVHLALLRERSTARPRLALIMSMFGREGPENAGWEAIATHPRSGPAEGVLSPFGFDCGLMFRSDWKDDGHDVVESAILFDGLWNDVFSSDDDGPSNKVMMLPGEQGVSFAFTELNKDNDGWWFKPAIDDCANKYSPAPPNTLAGAILRNLAHAPAGKRLDDLLIANAREKSKRVDAFLQEAKNDYEVGIGRLKPK